MCDNVRKASTETNTKILYSFRERDLIVEATDKKGRPHKYFSQY